MRGWGSAEPGQLGLAAVVAGHGVVASIGRVGARGDLRERQGSLVSAIQGALEGGLGRAATRGAARWLRRRTALPVGRAQGGGR